MPKTMSQLIEFIKDKQREVLESKKRAEKAAQEMASAAQELSSMISGAEAIEEETPQPGHKKHYRKGFLTANKRRMATAKHLLKLGMTPSQVARKIGCSSSSVYYAIQRGILEQPEGKESQPSLIGPPPPRRQPPARGFERKENVFFTPERLAVAKQLKAEGKGATEIGRALGCGEATVRYRIKMGDI